MIDDSSDISLKYCSKCEQFLPATPEFFSRNKRTKDGFHALCKVCDSARGKAYRESHQEQKQAYEKQRQPQKTERMRLYRQTEKNKAYRKQWQIRYNQEHREERKERDKQYHELHKEEVNIRRRQFRKDHPEVLTGIDRAHKHKRKALKRASKGNYTPQQLQEQYQRQKGKCYYCKTKVGKVWHADHVIPLNRGGSNDIHNIVVACPDCNMHKHDKLPHEWYQGNRLL